MSVEYLCVSIHECVNGHTCEDSGYCMLFRDQVHPCIINIAHGHCLPESLRLPWEVSDYSSLTTLTDSYYVAPARPRLDSD